MGWWNAGTPRVASDNSPNAEVEATLRTLVQTGHPQHVPARKLVAVFPWYGYSYVCNTTALLTPCENTRPFCCGNGTAAQQVSFAAALAAARSHNATVHRGPVPAAAEGVEGGGAGSGAGLGGPGPSLAHKGGSRSSLSPWFDYLDGSGARHQVRRPVKVDT